MVRVKPARLPGTFLTHLGGMLSHSIGVTGRNTIESFLVPPEVEETGRQSRHAAIAEITIQCIPLLSPHTRGGED